MERIGLYPGTFDPITKGHMDVISRALGLVDTLIIAIADDIPKTPWFSLEERVALVKSDIAQLKEHKRIKVVGFSGLLVEFARQQRASLLIRGLRAVSDFEYEIQLASMNSRLDASIQTVFLPASEQHQFIASRLVKEVARLKGDVSSFASKEVAEALKRKVAERG